VSASASFSDTFAIINTGSGDYYYKMVGSSTNTALNASTISINLLGGTLTLSGGQNKVSVTSPDYQKSWNVQNQNYRFYLNGSTAPSYSQFNNFTWSGDTYPNYTWQTNGANINLLSGRDSGTYKLDMSSYGQATYWNGSADTGFYMSDSATYTGTFNLYYGATGAGTQSSTFSGSGTVVKTGSGSTYTLDRGNTFTGGLYIDAGTVALTAANAATNGLIAIGQEFSGGGDAKLLLNAGDGTTFTNNIVVRATGGNRTIEFGGAAGVANTLQGNITNNNGFQATNTSGTLVLNGVISGNGGFEKAGNGTVTFSGSAANTHVGANTVTAGTLVFNKSANTAAIASQITVSSGATLRTDAVNQMNGQLVTVNGTLNLNNNGQQLSLAGSSGTAVVQLGNATLTNNNSDTRTFSGKIEGTGNLVKSGNGQLILTNTTSDFTGTTTVNGGLLTINNDRALGAVPGTATAGKIVVGAGSLGFNTTMALAANRGISLTSADSTLDAFGGATVTYDGIIAGSGTHGLNKAGGGTLVLGGNNSYTGLTTASNGVIRATHNNTFGTTAGGISVVSGAGVELSNSITIGSEDITLRGTGLGSAGALNSVSGNNTYNGLITLSGGDTYLGALSDATLNVGAINGANNALWVVGAGTTILSSGATNSGNSSSTALVKTNAGTVVLAASNAWAGNEFIRQGTVIISNNNALGVSGTTTIGADSGSATATLEIGSGIANSNSITVQAGGTGVRTLGYQSSGTTGTQLGSITLSEYANNVNSLAFNVVNNGTLLFGGGLTAGAGASATNRLALDGGGTLIVTNSSSGISSSDRFQVRIGNGTMVIGAGTIIARTNVAGVGHAIDLGVNLDGSQVTQTASLYASNGVTVSNSIYIGTTQNAGQDAGRVLGVRGQGSGATFSGPIGLADSDLTLNATNGTHLNVTGAVTNFSGTGALIKTGTGTATLAGNNSYLGATTIAGGTLRIDSNARLGNTNTTLTISNAGILQVTAASTISNSITIGAGNGVLSNSSGNRVIFSGNASKNGTVLTSRASTGSTNVFTGVISGASANSDFVVDGGTTIFSNAMTYNGPTIITNGGTLVLGVNNAVPTSSGLVLGGGTFIVGDSTTRYSQTLGTLTLTENSVIDLGSYSSGSVLQLSFADSSGVSWTSGKTLTITNWQGVAQQSSDVAEIIFAGTGLTPGQLGQVYWANQNINGGMLLSGTGELVPIPEPRVYAAAVALLAAVGWRERRRLLGVFRRSR